MLAGSKNSPETDCLANQNDTKSSLSDFFTSTVALGLGRATKVECAAVAQKAQIQITLGGGGQCLRGLGLVLGVGLRQLGQQG